MQTFETARETANAMARTELAAHRLQSSSQVLSDETIEAEGCWIFFLSEDVRLPERESGQLFCTAFAVSKCGSLTASVYDFRSNPAQMREYVEIWSLHALGRQAEASFALDAFNAKYA